MRRERNRPRLRAAALCMAVLGVSWGGCNAAAETLVEASALLTLPGRNAAVVAGDENSNGLWLVDLATTEPRLLTFPKAGKKPKKTNLDDLEALAPIGSSDASEFLAVTSHARNSRGELKHARSRIARIRLADDLRSIAAVDVYSKLREPLLESLRPLLDDAARLAAAEKSPAQGGLDIEGAAWWRGKLLLGLRSPAARHGKPIVAVLDSPASLFDTKKPQPKFLAPLVVPARSGEAIRGMTERGDDVLLILCASADAKNACRVVRWNPVSNSQSEVEVSGIAWTQPEGIGLAEDGTLWFAQDLEADAPAGAPALVACRRRSGATGAQAGGGSPPACVLSALLE